MIVTANQLSEIHGVDRRTITNWLNSDPPCPSWKEGGERRFDTAAVARWRETRAAEEALRKVVPADLEEARARKLAAEATLAEMEVAEREGSMIRVEDIDAILAPPLAALRAKLLNMPAKLTPVLLGARTTAQVRTVLDNYVVELMTELQGVGESSPVTA